MQSTLDRWRTALPGGNLGEQRSQQCISLPNTTHNVDGTNNGQSNEKTQAYLPSRLYYAKNPSHAQTLILSPTASIPAPTESKVFHQQNIRQFTKHKHDYQAQTHGENMPLKSPDEYRIVCHTIDCLGVQATCNHKQKNINDWFVRNEVDVVGWQEVGIVHHLFPKHERLSERLRDYRRRQIRVASANNKHENIDRFQRGGTAVVAYDAIANMSRSSGADESGLGRWSWIQLEGHNDRRVLVISAYNPCCTKTSQFATVHSQQKRHFLSKHCNVCPRLKFRQDLCSLLLKW